MSQINFHAIIRQQQEQLAVMQAQIQTLLAGGGAKGSKKRKRSRSSKTPNL